MNELEAAREALINHTQGMEDKELSRQDACKLHAKQMLELAAERVRLVGVYHPLLRASKAGS